MNLEKQLAGNQNRRMAAQDRMLARLDREDRQKERDVLKLGQLMRNGKIVYYTFPVGGKYRENSDPYKLV